MDIGALRQLCITGKLIMTFHPVEFYTVILVNPLQRYLKSKIPCIINKNISQRLYLFALSDYNCRLRTIKIILYYSISRT